MSLKLQLLVGDMYTYNTHYRVSSISFVFHRLLLCPARISATRVGIDISIVKNVKTCPLTRCRHHAGAHSFHRICCRTRPCSITISSRSSSLSIDRPSIDTSAIQNHSFFCQLGHPHARSRRCGLELFRDSSTFLVYLHFFVSYPWAALPQELGDMTSHFQRQRGQGT